MEWGSRAIRGTRRCGQQMHFYSQHGTVTNHNYVVYGGQDILRLQSFPQLFSAGTKYFSEKNVEKLNVSGV